MFPSRVRELKQIYTKSNQKTKDIGPTSFKMAREKYGDFIRELEHNQKNMRQDKQAGKFNHHFLNVDEKNDSRIFVILLIDNFV
jgi:hypothetical protein